CRFRGRERAFHSGRQQERKTEQLSLYWNWCPPGRCRFAERSRRTLARGHTRCSLPRTGPKQREGKLCTGPRTHSGPFFPPIEEQRCDVRALLHCPSMDNCERNLAKGPENSGPSNGTIGSPKRLGTSTFTDPIHPDPRFATAGRVWVRTRAGP